jgi:Gly-Xaa carboxypeptidase
VIRDKAYNSGNTDCKVYYNLTKNVFRYVGGPNGLDRGIVSRLACLADKQHTVDEHVSIAGHHHIVSWIHALVQNADRYDGEE